MSGYRDYGNSGFEHYTSAYVTDRKVRIDLDSYANDLYRWKLRMERHQSTYDNDAIRAHVQGSGYSSDLGMPSKPQLEDYLVVSERPATDVAKSSLTK